MSSLTLKILADGGRLDAYPERIYTENANAVTLIGAAATSYRGRGLPANLQGLWNGSKYP